MYNQYCLVIGGGISGVGAANLLLRTGNHVLLFDGNKSLDTQAIQHKIPNNAHLSFMLGELDEDRLEGIDLCVISPGVSLDLPFIKIITDKHIPIWSEIDLAYVMGKGRLAAITGTNGKTTTTSLVGEIFSKAAPKSFVVGNIGTSYTEEALKMSHDSLTVAEVSSFQLETSRKFKPHVSAILNITPDHLNRHKTMEEYIRVKLLITQNQDENDFCILNYEDEVLRRAADLLRPRVLFFSSKRELVNGAWLEDGKILIRDDGKVWEVCHVSELHLLGIHNYENVMAAALIAYCLGIDKALTEAVIKQFRAVEHRIEYVAELNGVAYYNDSKGTNPDASIQAVRAMIRPTLLIAGGYDKKASYGKWIEAFDGKVKKMVLIGQTAPQIAEEASRAGFTDYCFAESMKDAVKICQELAVPGDAVLLSPACASWDMYTSYEKRGNDFKGLITSTR